MKRLYRYLFPVLGLAVAGCSENPQPLDAPGASGTLTMKVSTRSDAAADDAYDPMEHLTVYIYNSNGEPIRKYTATEELPERLELLAGEYRVTVEAGEEVAASFTQRLYKGEKPFTVTPGVNTPVEVRCTLQNTVVKAVFDGTIPENFGTNFEVRVMSGAAYDESRADASSTLRYTENATGYFTLDEGVDALSWQFSGTQNKHGAVTKTGSIPDVRTPGKYTLTFRYSPDLPGFIEAVAIRVDDSTDDFDDTIIWSPDPTIEGDGFEISETQQYQGGEKRFLITTVKPTTAATLTFDGKPYDLLAAISAPAAGLAVEQTAENALTVTLSDDFFAGCTGGDHTLRFEASDNGGGNGSAECIFALQGVLAPSAADYDLWANTVTLRARVFDPSVTTVTFGLRTKNGSWQELPGTNAGSETWTATFSPEWTESSNESGLTVFTPKAGTGVRAEGEYECRAMFGERESLASFTTAGGQSIPGGDMEDRSMSCFTINNQTTAFWGSGNNNYMSAIIGNQLTRLCTQQEKSGSKCALLASQTAAGLLAAGNLFSGTFVKPSTQGTVGFGKDYDWQARPRALRLKYHATIGTVDMTKYTDASGNPPIAAGQPDRAIIYVAIVDWDAPHNVSSGMSAPSGMWDPSTATSQAEGPVIGYGRFVIKESTAGDEMVDKELEIVYYDKQTKPSKPCKIVISCSANMYGDYMNGCSTNRLYIDDFQWVY